MKTKSVETIIIGIIALVGLFIILDKENEEKYPYSDNHLYAIKYVGYDVEDLSEYNDITCVELEGDEYYYIEPRYTDYKVEIYENSLEDGRKFHLHTFNSGERFLLKCNQSDIFPNMTVVIYLEEDEFIEFSPYQSLKDGSIGHSEYGYEIK